MTGELLVDRMHTTACISSLTICLLYTCAVRAAELFTEAINLAPNNPGYYAGRSAALLRAARLGSNPPSTHLTIHMYQSMMHIFTLMLDHTAEGCRVRMQSGFDPFVTCELVWICVSYFDTCVCLCVFL